MRVTEVTQATGTWGLTGSPEDYDATPRLGTVLFDRQPRVLSPDRVALASYLFFGRTISGRLVTPQWHSPALAQAMVRDARPVWIQTDPVELYAKALPLGRQPMTVELEGVAAGARAERFQSAQHLRLYRSDRSGGARLTFNSLELSTNAWLFAQGRPLEDQLRVVLGCGVLFAEDLDADQILISADDVDVDAVSRLRNLLDTVRLGLEPV